MPVSKMLPVRPKPAPITFIVRDDGVDDCGVAIRRKSVKKVEIQ